jgi:hypothetical protein
MISPLAVKFLAKPAPTTDCSSVSPNPQSSVVAVILILAKQLTIRFYDETFNPQSLTFNLDLENLALNL